MIYGMNKKAIAILGAIFILIVGTLGFLIYSKYGKQTSNTPAAVQDNSQNSTAGNENNNQNPPENSTTTPPNTESPLSKFVKLTNQEQIVSPILFFNGSGITFFDNQGKLFQADLQDDSGTLRLNNARQLEIPAKTNIAKILWPSRGENFLAEFHSFGKKTWSFYTPPSGAYRL